MGKRTDVLMYERFETRGTAEVDLAGGDDRLVSYLDNIFLYFFYNK